MGKILVTGGCGYIGSHTIVDLLDNGFQVVSADSLLNSDEDVLLAIEEITGTKVKNYRLDLADEAAVRWIFAENPDLTGVIHFAALKSVNESMYKPIWYFQNNLFSTVNLAKVMVAKGVQHLIFSSSCSVYGNSTELPVSEKTALQPPECPYARTKVMGEEILQDICRQERQLQTVLLRYFNPAGAHPSAKMGENPINLATNLVPVITETAIGKRKKMSVFGGDYNTRDGSCVRDYIHVMDIANAHTKALQYLQQKKNKSNCEIYNLGIGEGVTVLEAIRAFERVSGVSLNYEITPRRAGDVEAVYADRSLIGQRLGWVPEYGIDEIMRSAWEWEKNRSR